jgi:hypothetical protein
MLNSRNKIMDKNCMKDFGQIQKNFFKVRFHLLKNKDIPIHSSNTYKELLRGAFSWQNGSNS